MKFSKRGFIAAWVAVSALVAGCEAIGGKSGSGSKAAAPLITGYTCCNLRYEPGSDWINELNYHSATMIPLGTPASVKSYGRSRASIDLAGKPMRLGQDYTREALSLEQYTRRMIAAEDPKIKLATYPKDVQEAIKAGRVMNGMNKEQIIMSVGYPLTQENPSMDAPMWRMWISPLGEYQLMWDDKGRVKEIVADPVTKNMIVYKAN
ncbi:MAG: hypothetical protein ACKVQA_18855 [Burkholderiales bacterium]